MVKNSERFINSFNRIERALRNLTNSDNYVTFSELVAKGNKKEAIVRRFKVDLLEFSELRNAIVHQRTSPDLVIAEPHLSIVEKIEQIEEEISRPKKVFPKFERSVACFTVYDSLEQVLDSMKMNRYSQFPIYDQGEFKGLLTTNGISNWLAENIPEDIISIKETTVAEVLRCEENKANFKFISRDTTIYEAEELFKEGLTQGSKIEALLITHNGRETESLLGIITSWDIIEIPKT